MKAIAIVVVDDHPLVRKGVEMVVSLEEDIEIVGLAANGAEAMKIFKEKQPDVALVDLRFPEENGLDIIIKAREMSSACKYIILTSYATEEEISRALAAGVDGYILKEAFPEELLSAIRLVNKGRKYYDPAVVQFAMENKNNSEDDAFKELTSREIEVIAAIAKGMKNKTIADTLFISEHTVKKHISQILEKLALEDRTQLALYAVSKGLDKLDLKNNP